MALGLGAGVGIARRLPRATGGDPSVYSVLSYSTDFVTGWEATPTGVNASGAKVWATNGVSVLKLGMDSIAPATDVVADQATYPTTDPFPVTGGKRQMRAEKLGVAISQTRKAGTLNSVYTCAFLDSAGFLAFRYGYVELNWKQLPGLLTGGSSAFWLGTNGWPPEIDVAENFTSAFGSPPTWSDFFGQHFIKYTGDGHDQQGGSLAINAIPGITPVTNLNAEFHKFGVEITPSTIYHYVDGIMVKSYPNRAPGTWWHVYLNTLNKRFSETPDPAGFPYTTTLDYLKFYTKPSTPNELWQWSSVSASSTYAWAPTRGTQQVSYSNGNKDATHAGQVAYWTANFVGNSEAVYSAATCASTAKSVASIQVKFDLLFTVGVATQAANMVSVAALYPEIGADAQSFGLSNYGWIQNNIAYADYAASGTFANITPGTVTIDIAADRPNNKIYIRVNGGNWNNNASANPVTGVGGLDISMLGSALLVLAAQTDQIGNTMKLLTPPVLSGYTQWGS